MRVAVTGGTGFVGRRVVARLTAAGHETVVLRAGLPEPVGFEVADLRCAPETPPW